MSIQVVERLQNSVHGHAAHTYGAFYSNTVGGIVTDPGLMFIPIDDHFVHKGHGVYETIVLKEGCLYQLQERLERLKDSASIVGLALPYSETAIARVILDTAAASRKLNGA
jgi:branched-subunit amino acid aminotransferase/4-amino-4-deoxychorismate lyase